MTPSLFTASPASRLEVTWVAPASYEQLVAIMLDFQSGATEAAPRTVEITARLHGALIHGRLVTGILSDMRTYLSLCPCLTEQMNNLGNGQTYGQSQWAALPAPAGLQLTATVLDVNDPDDRIVSMNVLVLK